MKFHFRSHDHHHHGGGGVVVPTDHPSALIVIDAHGGRGCGGDFRCAEYGGEHGVYALDASRHHGECIHQPSSPAESRHFASLHEEPGDNSPSLSDDSGIVGSGGSLANGPISKRALHLEHHESECPVANPDPHSRPRSRQYFRLGRHRSKGIDGDDVSPCCPTSDSSDDESHSERTTKRTTARRLRGNFGLRKPKLRRALSLPIQPPVTAVKPLTATIDCLSIEATCSAAAGDATSSNDAVASGSDDRLSLSEPPLRHHRRHVTFNSVQIREYSTILGDHRYCPSGPPLSLGWDLERENSMEFETYEKEREPIRVKCREDMRMGGEERRGILRSLMVTTTSSPGASGDEASRSDNDDDHHDNGTEKTTSCCVYSSKELCRAERRLTRERAGNSRTHRRINRGFFRPLTPEECESGADVVATTGGNDSGREVKEVGPASPMKEEVESSTAMDISPIKPPATR